MRASTSSLKLSRAGT
jgi:hypothetical protein